MQHGEEYLSIVIATLEKVKDTQQGGMDEAARRIADAIAHRNNVFVFGCSHAGILAEEAFYRTGGLAVINPIFFPSFMLSTRPVTITSALERLPGIGEILVEQNGLSEGDVLIIHSVSGRNTVPIEMSLAAREKGVYVIAITNIAYSEASVSRHGSGKRLFEVCDLAIDNCGAFGDAAVIVDRMPEPIGPTSTATGSAIINAVIVDAVALLVGMGIAPPVFISANLDGGDEHNKNVIENYRDNIYYMR